jgi:hypothetical protein
MRDCWQPFIVAYRGKEGILGDIEVLGLSTKLRSELNFNKICDMAPESWNNGARAEVIF